MPAIQDTGSKCVAGAGGSLDVARLGELDRAVLVPRPVATECHAAFGEVHDHALADSGIEQLLHRRAQFVAIELLAVAHLSARAAPGFKLIHDAVIHVLERGEDDLGKAVAVFAHAVDAGFQSGGLRGGEHFGCDRAVRRAGLIEPIEKQQVAEVENAGVGAGEVEVFRAEFGVRAARVEEGAPAGFFHRHHVGEARGRGLGALQRKGADAVL